MQKRVAFRKLAGEKGSRDLGQASIVREWWEYMADIMVTNPDHFPVCVPLEEVFYMG